MKTILHFAKLEKFIPPFINFSRNHLAQEGYQNFFFTFGDIEKYPYKKGHDSYHSYRSKNKISSIFNRYKKLIDLMENSEKIIIHGLFDTYLIIILSLRPQLLKKCYWIVWGGDLYYKTRKNKSFKYHYKEYFRKKVIKSMGHIVTYIDGDIKLIRDWYQSKAQHHECMMYLSNTFTKMDIKERSSDCISIQIGNSADTENNHFEILDALKKYKDENIKIYAPLSYGNVTNRDAVIAYGKNIFNDKFIALTDFMGFDDYLNFLANIDIAIFNHNRQQAMGNTINLLGLGKKVYLRDNTSQWNLFSNQGISIYKLDDFNLTSIDVNNAEKNMNIIANYYNSKNLESQYRAMLYKQC